jgi:two-component system alkaline phosphatase synthesis response regulator PhoP
MSHILIVDDEPNVASALAFMLQREGYHTSVIHDGRAALEQLRREHTFDLVLLDLNLGDPLVSGLVICREIRSQSHYLPVIMLTVYGSSDDKVMGLDVGADDYVTKPYNEGELLARIRATLRTVVAIRQHNETTLLEIDPYLQIEPRRRLVYCDGKVIDLTRRQFELLLYLALNPGRPWGRQTLLNRVWGEDYVGVDRTVDKHVSELRQKIEADPTDPQYILTEHGFGYRFRQW